MKKVYENGCHAINNVFVGIQKNECFGLLGRNGSGKTTTFKIMTGETSMTSGETFLNNYSVKKDLEKVLTEVLSSILINRTKF